MNLRRRSVLFLIVVIGLIAASAVVVAIKPVTLGLDLQGGVEVVLQGKPTRDAEVTPEAIARSVEVIRNRVDSFGVSEPEIQTQGSDQIVVSLPGAKNPDQVVEDLIKPAQLVFTDYEANFVASDPSLYKMVLKGQGTTPKPPIDGQTSYYLFKKNSTHTLLAGPDVSKDSLLQPFGGKVPANAELQKLPAGLVIYTQDQKLDPTKADSPSRKVYVLMQDHPGLTGRDITSAAQSFDQAGGSQQPIVTMQFTDQGAQKFQDVTRALAQRGALRKGLQSFAIVLDGNIISTPTVDYRQYPNGISGNNGAQISGNFTTDTARTLADQLNSGAIPIRLDVINRHHRNAGDQGGHTDGKLAFATNCIGNGILLANANRKPCKCISQTVFHSNSSLDICIIFRRVEAYSGPMQARIKLYSLKERLIKMTANSKAHPTGGSRNIQIPNGLIAIFNTK